ncbi:MAG: hypothetical protein GTN38_04150 [Candidatus Aenigmarchaeota archaeon]|nr:hypothetical protein [Candidatus Aenigmarchaeota archaeon]NIP40853.1 hypothetical protein [Candidatus Aenigmarchaeota archaeon]NIQ17967.1 hypothetical protein [Candidatus Aenigmarchaeota archaeon]NIS73556.1 hypothetical protein [Candidatus Aenigmarchaeota archaeon]
MRAVMILVVLVLAVVVSGCVTYFPAETAEEQACVNSGGSVTEGVCCLQTEDFPNTCLIGPCGCSPENSHEVKICDCGEGRCFDGDACVPLVTSFTECVEAGYPVIGSIPRECRTPDGRNFTEADEHCITPFNESMTLFEARRIASESDCVKDGTLKDISFCNADTATWWIDLDIEKPGCNPACVVSIVDGTAEINWRCTGII